jgi:hypothetical protein
LKLQEPFIGERRPQEVEPEVYLGLDFGGRQDYTAICALSRTQYLDWDSTDAWGRPTRRHRPDAFHIVMLHRWELNTDNIKEVVPDVHRRIARIRADAPKAFITLVPDFTGAGADPVAQLIDTNSDDFVEIKPTWFSSGAQEHKHRKGGPEGFDFWTVPRINLLNIGNRGMLVGLGAEEDRKPVRIAKALQSHPLSETLVKEMRNVDPRLPTNARLDDTLAAWRENEHDDLVFAYCMAAWAADRGFEFPFVINNFVK